MFYNTTVRDFTLGYVMKYVGAIVRYNDKPEMGGEAFGPFINIKPKYKEDEGLHVHEYVHVLQWYFWLGFFTLLGGWVFYATGELSLAGVVAAFGIVTHNAAYAIIRPYQKWCEVYCYRKQIACYPKGTSIDFAVEALMRKYTFKMTEAEARKALS